MLFISFSLLTCVNAYSYNVSTSIYYTECSGYQNNIHYTFKKGTVNARNCKAICGSDNDSSVTRKPSVYIELKRRTLIGGIGYKSFGEKKLGTIIEGKGWTNLKNTSWKTDEKNSSYYVVIYMTSSHVKKNFKCALKQ